MRIVVRRGQFVESLHPVKWVALRKGALEGNGVRTVGHFRSCAKPFQAAAMLHTNLLERFSLESDELSIACSSHGGTDLHVATIKKMLSRAGLDESALLCGAHPPLDRPTRRMLLRRGEDPTPARHNCSGKHALMLLACVHKGWDIKTYPKPEHPVQKACTQVIKRITGARKIGFAVDGCGVVEFVIPFWAMVRAYHQLAYPRVYREELDRLRRAIQEAPVHFAYEKATPTMVLQVTGGRIIMKTGGGGLRCGVDTESGVAFAVKTTSGSVDIPTTGPERRYQLVDMAAIAVMRYLGLLSSKEYRQLAWLERVELRNWHGDVVGEAVVEM